MIWFCTFTNKYYPLPFSSFPQVGGGKGPGNPHGEESELTYFIDRGVIERKYCNVESVDDPMTIDIVVNTDLEHVW